MKKYYTTTEISELLGVTAATVNKWIKEGDLPAFKTPGGHHRIKDTLLINFMQKNNVPIPVEMEKGNKPRILVVEDDEDVRAFVTAVLEDFNMDVEIDVATDGFMAGNKVVKFRPDLVILDIMLPGVNGVEICKFIRKELGDDAQVLAVTGYFSEKHEKDMKEAGANEFMRKPMELDAFSSVIEKLLLKCSDKYYLQQKRSSGLNKAYEKNIS